MSVVFYVTEKTRVLEAYQKCHCVLLENLNSTMLPGELVAGEGSGREDNKENDTFPKI